MRELYNRGRASHNRVVQNEAPRTLVAIMSKMDVDVLAAEIDESNALNSQGFAVRTQAKLCGQLAQGNNPFTRSSFQGNVPVTSSIQ